jgi:hypothetical protein
LPGWAMTSLTRWDPPRPTNTRVSSIAGEFKGPPFA